MRNIAVLIGTVMLIVGCSISTPAFSEDNAWHHLLQQMEIGYRYPGSEEIELCRQYIINELTKTGAVLETQHFEAELLGTKLAGVNIIASYHPQMSRRILLGTHYDTRATADLDENPDKRQLPIMGANDGGSGVAVLLELARIIASNPPNQFGIDIVFFDLEDSGEIGINESWCLGSSHFARHFTGPLPEKAIIVDMVGDSDLKIEMEFVSYHSSPMLVKDIWDKAQELGFRQFQPTISNSIYDDHVPLIRAGFNAVLLIDFDYKWWHTTEDTIDKCSPQSLAIVGQTLLAIIYDNEKSPK
jgi:Zn-dependent M28 family amino/carboxypeptidase